LLEWEDEWKEVIEVDTGCTDINRYYVISRPEDVGRLSLNKQDGYPELIEIGRKPLNLKKITFLSTFQITLERSDREGKKTDHFFELSQEGDALSETLNDFRRVVEEEGIDLKDLRPGDQDRSGELYEKIRRKLGIKASSRQQDVYDFIAYLAGVQRPAS
jgi:ribosomal protein S21